VLRKFRFLRKHVAHFATLTPEATKRLAAKVTAHSLPKGALLCKQGSRADSLLVLLRGRAAVYVDKRGKATEGHNWPAAMSPGESSHSCCCTPSNLRVFRLYIPINTYVHISIRSMTLAVSMPARLSGQKHAARTLR
jgi:hypothetical protein